MICIGFIPNNRHETIYQPTSSSSPLLVFGRLLSHLIQQTKNMLIFIGKWIYLFDIFYIFESLRVRVNNLLRANLSLNCFYLNVFGKLLVCKDIIILY